MSDFGTFLKKKRKAREITQVRLSDMLGQKGIGISNSVISYWENGSRLPRDTNRNDLIAIGEILRLSAEDTDTLLLLAGLAPVQAEDEEEKKKKYEVSETVVEFDLPYHDYSYDQYLREGWHTPIIYQSFILDTLSSHILINTVQVRTSHPNVQYQLMLFEEIPPEEIGEWDNEDIIQMERVTQRVYTWGRGFLVPYRNREGKKQVYGGIGTGKKPTLFGMEEEEFSVYIRRPIQYEIRLQYRVL